MKILNVTDTEFKAYGKVLEGYDTAELFKGNGACTASA